MHLIADNQPKRSIEEALDYGPGRPWFYTCMDPSGQASRNRPHRRGARGTPCMSGASAAASERAPLGFRP
ncbi:uncharacterized protein GLRG_04878 [Colletotrichum graminicola M1.001]|uniref:Uncharacterized protein n=1 Tax=Colletotrichum graminicola (strain M1.001 / M2 / FGSC 10212) TaxID=645133 RepID=E3QFP9_COLGM|nr:uncharacterized protein GLRG_04878 [Colletotrichum graminicola M1.001]EFQ29734.1 hypothetical protein GLRG_04878 [Colletotrichum graminicola M1.001]